MAGNLLSLLGSLMTR